jgi:hypothetical protein
MGNSLVSKKVGYVAEFCPICRRAMPHRVERINSVNNLQALFFRPGEQVGHLGKCQGCRLPSILDLDRYQSLAPKLSPDFLTLIAETFPNLESHHHDRLELERQIQSDPLTIPPQTRAMLIDEPFHLLSRDRPAQRLAIALADRNQWIKAILGAIVCLLIANSNRPIGFGLFAIVAVVYTTLKNQHQQRAALGRLGSALHPLQPSPEELATALERMPIVKFPRDRFLSSTQNPLPDSVYFL